ncbi:MAG: hypothetical protein ACHREM_14280 [Polyangiales bacterium]
MRTTVFATSAACFEWSGRGGVGVGVLIAALAGCSSPSSPASPTDGGVDSTSDAVVQEVASDGGYDAPLGPLPTITITARTTRFVVREHMLAAVEMQLSGEPFAEAMGRVLADYSRDYLPPNIYFDTSPTSTGPFTDLAGFSCAVESYEYSKQPMNNLSFESGAGTSLAYGPVLNASGVTGAAACGLLRAQVQAFAVDANTTGAARFSTTATTINPLGWPGLWPALAPFVSFDPAIAATDSVSQSCSITSDDDPGLGGSLVSDDYECDATGLHLPNRSAQVDAAISPGATGWAGWKSMLWVLNYLQVMHDSNETAIQTVAAADLAKVGTAGNTVAPLTVPDGVTTAPVAGVFLGSSNIEGFQAGLMITALDNESVGWLTKWTTTDGATLSGFADLPTALAYDFSAPLRWFPSEMSVAEATDSDCMFPRPTGYTVRAGGSHLLDLDGILGAYASAYALTDTANSGVGGAQSYSVYFDGDPFPVQTKGGGLDQTPTGSATLHDRSLAMMRVALVDMIRMHKDPTSGILVSEVTMTGGTPTRGTTISASDGAYTLLALRTTRRTLSDQLQLYSNTTPDTAVLSTPIDVPAFSSTVTATQALNTLIKSLADLYFDHLTDATGRAYVGWDVSKGAPTTTNDTLDAHTAAVRALFVAYLSTGVTKYRDRATAVYQRVEATFWDASARLYRPTAGDTSSTVTYTPLRFVMLQAMLRDTYELTAITDAALAAHLRDRVARVNKLVLNGWDDVNGDGKVDWPQECVQISPSGLPLGGLQLGERTLSGETGSTTDTFDAGARVAATDREHDCVPEISAAGLPSALADSITFTIESATK